MISPASKRLPNDSWNSRATTNRSPSPSSGSSLDKTSHNSSASSTLLQHEARIRDRTYETHDLGCLIGGLACLLTFFLVEAKVASPMVPMELFRSRSFLGANLLTFSL